MASVRETTYHVGRSTWRETEFKQPNVRNIDGDVSKCIQDMYCNPCELTSGKVARVVLWTGSLAAAGALAGPPGAAVGAGIGFGIGFCTIL